MFQSFFNRGKKLSQEGVRHCEFGLKILPLRVTSLQDLSSTWKTLVAGGAAKVEKIPCHLYLVSSSEFAHFKLDDERCSQCKEDNVNKCVCHDVTDNIYVQKINDYLLTFIEKNENDNTTYEQFVEKHKQLRVETKAISDSNIVSRHTNMQHIDFDPSMHS